MAVEYPGQMPLDVTGSRRADDHAGWLRKVRGALEEAHFALYMLWGGLDGVVQVGAVPADSLKVIATAPASLNVTVNAGAASAFESVCRRKVAGTVSIPAPVTHPRIDLLQFNMTTRLPSRKAGAEAVAPVAPTADANCIPLAQVYCRPAMASVKDADDSVQGYLTDVRVFVNA